MAFRPASLLILAMVTLPAPVVLAAPAPTSAASQAALESRPPAPPFDLVRIGQASDGSVSFLDLASLRPGPQPTALVVTVYPRDRPVGDGSLRDRIAGRGLEASAGAWTRLTITCARRVMSVGASAGAFDAEGRLGLVLISSPINAGIEPDTPQALMSAAACDNRPPAGGEHFASLKAAIRATRAPAA